MRTLKVTTTIVETIETMQGDTQVIEGTTQDYQEYVSDPDATITVTVEEIENEVEPEEEEDPEPLEDD